MHEHFMQLALEEAWRGRGHCSPNPSVGAVAVVGNKIIAKGFHKGVGTAHAERAVLDQIPSYLEGLTLYVTLEPCNHWGRTPPCVNMIIEKKVSQVIYGFKDPNPLVKANDTPGLLERAGISVLYYPLEKISAFYHSYQYWTLRKLPWVTVKNAQSFDGKIAGPQGKPQAISNQACELFTHFHRRHSDLILTTSRTVLADNPRFTARYEGLEEKKVLGLIDRRLQLTGKERLFQSAKACHIFYEANKPLRQSIPNVDYHPIPLTEAGLDLKGVIECLGELGYHDVWVEGGGSLFSALHEAGLVQRTFLYFSPQLLGENATPLYQGKVFSRQSKVSWQIKEDNVIACLDWQE